MVDKETLIQRKSLIDYLIMSLTGLYFILQPFYFWKSGIPQLADIIIVFAILIFLIKNKFTIYINERDKSIFTFLILFITHIILINSFWVIRLNQLSPFFMNTIFYIYNVALYIYIYTIIQKYEMFAIKVIKRSVILSVTIQIILFLLSGGFMGKREIAFFNNPNQLGYYGLLMFSIIIVLNKIDKFSKLYYVLLLIFSSVLAMISLSKGALISLFFLILSILIKNLYDSKSIKNVVSLTIVIFMIILKPDFIFKSNLIKSVENRLANIGSDSDDSLEGRGYDRIINYPEYWIFGAGEGAYYRFDSRIEFHSTLGNIQVSYGFIGIVIFLLIIINSLKGSNPIFYIVFLSILLYGLTHNGVRNGVFWILLAMITTFKREGFSNE